MCTFFKFKLPNRFSKFLELSSKFRDFSKQILRTLLKTMWNFLNFTKHVSKFRDFYYKYREFFKKHCELFFKCDFFPNSWNFLKFLIFFFKFMSILQIHAFFKSHELSFSNPRTFPKLAIFSNFRRCLVFFFFLFSIFFYF